MLSLTLDMWSAKGLQLFPVLMRLSADFSIQNLEDGIKVRTRTSNETVFHISGYIVIMERDQS